MAVEQRTTDAVGAGVDYASHAYNAVAFDFEGLMSEVGLSLDTIRRYQSSRKVGTTPLHYLETLTELVRRFAPVGKGARIFLKDEAANPTGSFKARRATLPVLKAVEGGYGGIVAATSGNYGAAVASQAAMVGLRCIVLQEAFDSRRVAQPEILEKARACAAYGAEVRQLSVGPELFDVQRQVLAETGYFNGSLYTPFAVAGIETLGWEIGTECRKRLGRAPDIVLVTHAGGGNITGTARGLVQAGCTDVQLVAVSVDLGELHMASDSDFNRKSFTTGHTGFGIPFAIRPDRADVPFNAARPLRYMDRYVTVTQGEVFFATQALAILEGLERGPAGNTALAAAMAIAADRPDDEVLVVQESEYTGAGKHASAQLTFARDQGVTVRLGDPRDNAPGMAIVIPKDVSALEVIDVDLSDIRHRYLRSALERLGPAPVDDRTVQFLAADTRLAEREVRDRIAAIRGDEGSTQWTSSSSR